MQLFSPFFGIDHSLMSFYLLSLFTSLHLLAVVLLAFVTGVNKAGADVVVDTVADLKHTILTEIVTLKEELSKRGAEMQQHKDEIIGEIRADATKVGPLRAPRNVHCCGTMGMGFLFSSPWSGDTLVEPPQGESQVAEKKEDVQLIEGWKEAQLQERGGQTRASEGFRDKPEEAMKEILYYEF